ncbi:hypothetical protein BJ508DRAFT_349596, partial [Ascobolus immersus RN42]
ALPSDYAKSYFPTPITETRTDLEARLRATTEKKESRYLFGSKKMGKEIKLKGTPDRALMASYTYTPSLPSNGAIPGHSTFHLYLHPFKSESTTYLLFQTVPITAATDRKTHLSLIGNPAHTGLAYSLRRHGGWTSEWQHFYRGANPEDATSIVHRATVGDIHGRGLRGAFSFGKEITFEPPSPPAYGDEKVNYYETTPTEKVRLEEKSKKWGTETFYNLHLAGRDLFWRDTEVSTPDPTLPNKDERDRFTLEGHMSLVASVTTTIKGHALRPEEHDGIVVARLVKPIHGEEKKCYHKLGRVEFVWEGCERVWGEGWDRVGIVEGVLLTAGLVAGKRHAEKRSRQAAAAA